MIETREHVGEGFVYLMTDEFERVCKVGWSMKPWQRHKDMAKSNPGLKLLIFFPGDRRFESAFHRAFKSNRTVESKEWFRFGVKNLEKFLIEFAKAAYFSFVLSGIPTAVSAELLPIFTEFYDDLSQSLLESVQNGPNQQG